MTQQTSRLQPSDSSTPLDDKPERRAPHDRRSGRRSWPRRESSAGGGNDAEQRPPRRQSRALGTTADEPGTSRVDHRLRRGAVTDQRRTRDRRASPADDAEPTCVLVAEDEPALLSLLVGALRRRGFMVVEARTGRELWSKVRASLGGNARTPAIDLIIADVELTDFSTLDVLAAIRRLDGALPVVLTTAMDADTIRADAQALGADCVLGKPFAVDALLAHVIELCR